MIVEISYTVTSEYVWSGDFEDLPAELRHNVSGTATDEPDDMADVIAAEITDVDLSTLNDAELQSESYEVDSVTADA